MSGSGPARHVFLRRMDEQEYTSYASRRDAEYEESLAASMTREAARAKARADRERFLPRGLATDGHLLVVAEDGSGTRVGAAWLCLSDPRTDSTDDAWLFDIEVEPERRGDGWGRALLRAVEVLAAQEGAQTLALNVFGHNRAAVALYDASGYRVTTQQMLKELPSREGAAPVG